MQARLRQVGAEIDDAAREKQMVEWQSAHQTAAADEFLSRIEAVSVHMYIMLIC